MKLEVRLFAMLRERAGADSLEIELDDGATTEDALAALRLAPGLGEMLERMPVRVAVNREYAEPGTELHPGDELAVIPPVSGGAPDREAPAPPQAVVAEVTAEPLDADALARAVARPAAGAIVTFQGTTRDVDRLEYEAYAEMAGARIADILRECVERHGLEAAAAAHRIGEVPLGEPSVVVAVSAAHRPEAFAGAREVIDRIKAETPIWKKEIEGDDERWVEGKTP